MIPPIRVIIFGDDQLTKTVKGITSGLQTASRGFTMAGTAMTAGLTVPIAAMGVSTIKTAGDFQLAMNKVQNLTGASAGEFKQLEKMAREFGSSTVFSASQAADGMATLGQAGFTTSEIIGAMPGTINLAAAAGIEFGQAADIASGMLRTFGLETSKMAQVSDVLTTAANKSNTDILGLAEGMKYVGPVAATMGIGIQEVSAALGILSNANIKAEMGGTVLRNILSELVNPAKDAAETLDKLKIPRDALIDSKGNVKSFQAVLEAFEKSGAGADDMLKIFGKHGGPGMAALMKQGSGALANLRGEIDQASGSAMEAATVRTRGFNGQLRLLTGAFEELQLTIAESGLLEFVTKIAEKLTSFVKKITEANPNILKMAVVFAMVAAAIGPLLLALGGVAQALSFIMPLIASAGGIMAILSNPIGWVVGAILALIGVFMALKIAFGKTFSQMFAMMGPVGAMVGWIIERWSRLLPFFKLLFITLGGLFKFFATVLGVVLWPVMKILEGIGKTVFALMDGILWVVEKLAGLILPDWLKNKIGLTVPGGASPARDAGAIQAALVSNQNVNENKTSIVIDNRTDARIRTMTDKGDVTIDAYSGETIAGVAR